MSPRRLPGTHFKQDSGGEAETVSVLGSGDGREPVAAIFEGEEAEGESVGEIEVEAGAGGEGESIGGVGLEDGVAELYRRGVAVFDGFEEALFFRSGSIDGYFGSSDQELDVGTERAIGARGPAWSDAVVDGITGLGGGPIEQFCSHRRRR